MDEQIALEDLESAKRRLEPISNKILPYLDLAIQSTEENILPDSDRTTARAPDTGASKEEHNNSIYRTCHYPVLYEGNT